MEQKNNEILDDLAIVRPLAAIIESEGGKIIFDSLLTTILSQMNFLCDNYTSKSHVETMALISEMKAYRDIAKTMSSAKTNKEFLEDELKRVLEQQ